MSPCHSGAACVPDSERGRETEGVGGRERGGSGRGKGDEGYGIKVVEE